MTKWLLTPNIHTLPMMKLQFFVLRSKIKSRSNNLENISQKKKSWKKNDIGKKRKKKKISNFCQYVASANIYRGKTVTLKRKRTEEKKKKQWAAAECMCRLLFSSRPRIHTKRRVLLNGSQIRQPMTRSHIDTFHKKSPPSCLYHVRSHPKPPPISSISGQDFSVIFLCHSHFTLTLLKYL